MVEYQISNLSVVGSSPASLAKGCLRDQNLNFDIFDLGGTKAVWGYFGAYSSVVEQYIDNVFVRGSNPLRLKRYAFGIPLRGY